jgi:hypothetical protein
MISVFHGHFAMLCLQLHDEQRRLPTPRTHQRRQTASVQEIKKIASHPNT